MKRVFRLPVVFLLCFMSIAACASWKNQQGVQNRWRDDSVAQVQVGKTTQSEVADLFGPPSQIIGLQDQVIFYYLLEQKKGRGAFFIIYNYADIKTIYDRAIFFFDPNGVLTDYAYSAEKAEQKR